MNKLVFLLLLSVSIINGQEGADCSDDSSICDFDPSTFLKCVEGKCKCEDDLVWTTDNCTIPFGKPCEQETGPRCNSESFHTCADGQCACKDEEWKYDSKSDKCSLKEGAICEEDEPCYSNSKCEMEDSEEEGVCRCLGNFPPNKNRECLYDHGAQCDPGNNLCNSENRLISQCDPGNNLCNSENRLICNSATLRCECNAETKYDEVAKECRKPLDAECKDDVECSTLTVCSTDGKCDCAGTLVRGAAGNCVIEYEKQCGLDEHIGACDQEGNQICKGNKCVCIQDETMTYDQYLKSCYVPKGKRCYSNTNCHPDFTCDTKTNTCECGKDFIDEDDECKITFGKACREEGKIGQCSFSHNLVCGSTSNKCECKEKYVGIQRDSFTVCLGNYSASCTVPLNCNLDRSLTCNLSTKKCGCFYPNDQEYVEEEGACKSLVEGYCDLVESDSETKPRFISCGANMECVKTATGNSNECRCRQGFLELGRTCNTGNSNIAGLAFLLISGILVLIR
ncbi:unnamed protein product [Allacma fusca]|uniref:Uncharacterized protein n=1 Tax=Allacma fusca TaxID=39272 RepID=A0A8J2LRJ8_9HEXA|nr:unnamed protein product [Allacma fusca]